MHLKKILHRERITLFLAIGLGVIFAAVIFFRLPFAVYRDNQLTLTPLEIDLHSLDFSGEKVPTDPWVNPFGLQKIEEEILITRLSLYQILLYHRRASTYFPYIESYFRESSIPDDFKYLAVAESGLENDALSHAGARWIWQLMPDTARQYGLRVDAYIDERLHFERATRVAAAHILHLHEIFDNWTLAAAAYNRWESWLIRDQRAQPTAKNYYQLILNKETWAYVYRIVAIKYLMQNRWKLFSRDMLTWFFSPADTSTEMLQGPIADLRVWCLEHGWEYQELRELNPWILGYSLPAGPWEVKRLLR